jgi:hypothetical protein
MMSAAAVVEMICRQSALSKVAPCARSRRLGLNETSASLVDGDPRHKRAKSKRERSRGGEAFFVGFIGHSGSGSARPTRLQPVIAIRAAWWRVGAESHEPPSNPQIITA